MFAQWLMENRSSRDMTAADLAKKAVVSQSRFAQLEGGASPTREIVDRLCQALAYTDADPDVAFEIYRDLLKSGLLAAGLVSESDLKYFEPEEDVLEIVEGNPQLSLLQRADLHREIDGMMRKHEVPS